MDNKKQHQNILKELHEMYCIKNEKYGNAFSESVQEWGFTTVGITVSHKYKRMAQLIKESDIGKDNGTDESLRDTLADLANYCILSIMELDNIESNKGDDNGGN